MPTAHKSRSTSERKRQLRRVVRRRAHLKSAYGITPEQFDALFESQGKCCAICKRPEPESLKGWQIDHCHATDKVRGILCHWCNLTIGHANDDAQLLIDAVFYLLKHKGEPCLQS